MPSTKKLACKLWISFGRSGGILKSSVQITDNYAIHTLIGLVVRPVVNMTLEYFDRRRRREFERGLCVQNGAIFRRLRDQDVVGDAHLAPA